MDSLLILNHFADQPNNLARFGVTFGLQFGIDQRSVDSDLEAASVRGNQHYRFNHMLKFLEQIFFQAHGPVGVMSDCAVDNFNLKHRTSQC